MENAFCRCGLGYTEGIAPLRREFKETTHKRVPKVSALADATDALVARGASLQASQVMGEEAAAHADTGVHMQPAAHSARARQA